MTQDFEEVKIFYGLNNYEEKNSVVTLGTFDGIHLGHRSVLEQLKDTAKSIGGKSVVFTFFPHPRLVVESAPENLRLLTTLEEKIELLREIGIDNLIVYPFTKEFASIPYNEFVESILVEKLHMTHLVVGYDHKFGKNREGSFENLERLALKNNFQIDKLSVYLESDTNISSTKIRNRLEEGHIDEANQFLGYDYQLTGKVVTGQQLGRTIGFPTANVAPSDPNKMVPKVGVYAVRVSINNQLHGGMLNIGYRPTINTQADKRSIEVHVFDFDKDLYNSIITLKFVSRIRDEQRFESIEHLKNQLQLDKIEAQKLLQKID